MLASQLQALHILLQEGCNPQPDRQDLQFACCQQRITNLTQRIGTSFHWFLKPASFSVNSARGFCRQVLDASKVYSSKHSRPYSRTQSTSKFLFLVFIMETKLQFGSDGLLFTPQYIAFVLFLYHLLAYPYTWTVAPKTPCGSWPSALL
jgi:hypothetical protein